MPHKLVTTKALLLELKELLQSSLGSTSSCEAFVGFDGFIDTIQKPVRQRRNEHVSYFTTINDFAEHLQNLNGKSGQVELVTDKVKMGGNAPIFSIALGRLGIMANCVGAMGLPEISPIFKNSQPLVKMISVAQPGKSNALEFDDGKIIFSDLSIFEDYNWNYIKQKIDLTTFRKSIEACRLFAMLDWANLPEATDLWQGFLEEVIKPRGKRDQFFFFDLCDPSKKSTQHVDEVLDLVSDFSRYGRVTLGMNENEANKIWMAMTGHDHALPKESIEIPPLEIVGLNIPEII